MSKFWHNFPEITKEYQLDFGQGGTPLHTLSFDNHNFAVKDETKNPTGSFKDRGLSYQIAKHIKDGKRQFAISSSGNAAISAAYIAKLHNLELNIFIGDSINAKKLGRITNLIEGVSSIKLFKSQKPRSDLVKFIRDNADFVNLRGSTDEYAPVGYKSIAYELAKDYPDIDAIFVPTSSGTSAVGIASGFQELNSAVQIHICQSEKIHPIAKTFDSDFKVSKTSLADAITDKVAHRKNDLVDIINTSGGSGWVLSDTELLKDQEVVNSFNIGEFSFNSVLAFSGFQKALRSGYNFNNPVLLFSGL